MMMVRPEIRISELGFENPFQGYPTCPHLLSPGEKHLALEIQVPGAGNWHLAYYQNLASGVSLKKAFKTHFRDAYFRSLVYSSWNLWPIPDSGDFAPCILSRKIGGSQNLMKEPHLSKTPILTFVYLSTCNIKLPGIFGRGWQAIAMLKPLSLFISLSLHCQMPS